MDNLALIDTLIKEKRLTLEELSHLIETCSDEELAYASKKAQEISKQIFGNKVYIRGIIEFSNFCRNNCLYCGIRAGNTNLKRYRLTEEQILSCCESGYTYGYRTFVLQSGEDPYYDDNRLCQLVEKIRNRYPDCAITLSLGERSYDSYKKLKEAGADRYLLRHETADEDHYHLLHPKELSFQNRMACLQNLKSLGYQVGCGFMVGSPYQTPRCLAKDLLFIADFKPHMVGIGPFIPHNATPFKDKPSGTLKQTLLMLSLIRITLPDVLLPATTALGTIDPQGREKGILAGANVMMPNLSPTEVRKLYLLYDNKICTTEQSEQCRFCLEQRLELIGYKVVVGRGDSSRLQQN